MSRHQRLVHGSGGDHPVPHLSNHGVQCTVELNHLESSPGIYIMQNTMVRGGGAGKWPLAKKCTIYIPEAT